MSTVKPLQPTEERWMRTISAHPFTRFLFFGVLNAGVTYGIYVGCLSYFDFWVSYTISFLSGIVISYYFNTRFIFNRKMEVTRSVIFALAYLCQYGWGLILLHLVIVVAGMSKIYAPLLVLFATVPMNFLINRWILKASPPRGLR